MTALTSAAMRTMMQFHQEIVLVSVSGIDGSGKTDLIKSVVNELQQSGVEAASARFDLVDVIPGHSLPDYIYSLFIRSGNTTDSDAIIGDCITFEYLKFHMETVSACQPNVRVLVLDRYIWDYLLTNEIVFQALTTTQQSLMRAIPLPQVKIFLDCDPDTAINRIVKRQEKRTQLERRDILEEKRSRYLAMSRELAGIIIDGTLSKSDVRNQAMAAISCHLKAPAE
jgi:thymidylate kinase